MTNAAAALGGVEYFSDSGVSFGASSSAPIRRREMAQVGSFCVYEIQLQSAVVVAVTGIGIKYFSFTWMSVFSTPSPVLKCHFRPLVLIFDS